MATVVIPALLRKLTGGKDRTLATGATLKEIIDDLERQFPGFRERVVAGDDLVGSLAVSIDGEIITGGLMEPVQPDSEVHFVPAIGGGAGRL
jgi:molybdopterin synthase sulfur carrier subunit